MESYGIGPSISWLIGENLGVAGLVVANLLFVSALFWIKTDSAKMIENGSSAVAAIETAPKTKVKDEGGSEIQSSKVNVRESHSTYLRNVFSVKQRPIATCGNGSNSNSKQASSERPFESSYYFAHNSKSTGGGYKDGLCTEDFQMNGPRLLSKGGVRVEDEPDTDVPEKCGEENIQSSRGNTNGKLKPPPKLKASAPITKYMWDDNGSGDVAKIHINSLPISSSETIEWESAGISREQVEARLIGKNNEGLSVSIVTQEGKRYHLHVARMYGAAESATCIIKKHKLLVKIIKKKIAKRHSKRHATDNGIWKAGTKLVGRLTGGGEEAKEEFTSLAWPTLTASSAGDLGRGTSVVDEKLFKGPVTNGGRDDEFDQWSR